MGQALGLVPLSAGNLPAISCVPLGDALLFESLANDGSMMVVPTCPAPLR
jgi:hypothetical protein